MRQHLAELDALKQGFIANISHELRTPLAKIREALALLGDGAVGELADRQKRVVGIARDACEKQIRMVSTLLDLSRLRARKVHKLESSQSIDPVVREAISLERSAAAPREVTVQFEAVDQAPSLALDAPLLERAVANLVRNAVSASPQGKTVHVTRSIKERGPTGERGPFIKIEVKDEGPGVPEDIREHLFEPFVSKPTQKGAEGIGLGLAFVREVARAHRGEVLLESSDASGSVFAMWLPISSDVPASRP
jgi:two-component system sensor histidine kinase GlrK